MRNRRKSTSFEGGNKRQLTFTRVESIRHISGTGFIHCVEDVSFLCLLEFGKKVMHVGGDEDDARGVNGFGRG
jgi:hypothetical protein